MKKFLSQFAMVIVVMIVTFNLMAIFPLPELIKTVSSSSVPEQLSTNNDTHYRTIVFTGNKSARTTNTSKVWLQQNPTNDAGGFYIQPGERIIITDQQNGVCPTNWWIDVETASDGVSCELIP
jgi:hypothetical protein